jgi:hypothetical protein
MAFPLLRWQTKLAEITERTILQAKQNCRKLAAGSFLSSLLVLIFQYRML